MRKAAILIVAGLAFAAISAAQDGYKVTETDKTPPVQTDQPAATPDENATPATTNKEAGPVRLARFSYIKGNVTWRASEDLDWSTATMNLPIREGSQIWVADGGRAEIQFDDGSLLHLGNGAVATLQTLYSDSDGEFTEVKLTEGLASITVTHKYSAFQIDTPLVTVKTDGASDLRVGVGDDSELALRGGSAVVEGNGSSVTLHDGDYVDVQPGQSDFKVESIPDEDSFDHFVAERDKSMQTPTSNLPSNIGLVAGDLDTYGTWHDDTEYGNVWCPEVPRVGWRPYSDGHWVWCDPFGWTWVADEPWGWAPYHYGTWVYRPYGWAWVPGPFAQVWSPAVVTFTSYGGDICWAPLAPWEVRYPAFLSLGFGHGNWSLFFSIGCAGVYTPFSGTYCSAVPWGNWYVNRYRFHNGFGFRPNNVIVENHFHFIPSNARLVDGASRADIAGFRTASRFEALPRGQASVFERGQSFVPDRGRLLAGPSVVAPDRSSLTPSHTFLPTGRNPSRALGRQVYRPGGSNSSGIGAPSGNGRGGVRPDGAPGRVGTGNRADTPAASTGSVRGSSSAGSRPGASDSVQDRVRRARESLGWNSRGGSSGASERSSGGFSRGDSRTSGGWPSGSGSRGTSSTSGGGTRAYGGGTTNNAVQSRGGSSQRPFNYGESRGSRGPASGGGGPSRGPAGGGGASPRGDSSGGGSRGPQGGGGNPGSGGGPRGR